MSWVVTSQGTAQDAGGAGVVTKTISGGTITVGSLVVVGVRDANSGLGPVTDSKSNSYTLITSNNLNNNGSLGAGALFYSVITTQLVNGVDSISYTEGEPFIAAMSIISATGNAASPLDTAVTASAGGSSTSPSVTSGTPSISGELFIEFVAAGNTTTFTLDTGNGWATPPASFSFSNAAGGGGNQVNAGTGTKTAAPTLGTSRSWAAIVVGFKPLSGAYTLSASTGTFAETGNAAGFALQAPAAAASYSLTGNAALFNVSQPSSTGTFNETGNAVLFNLNFPAAAASYAVTLNSAPFVTTFEVSAGAYVVTYNEASFITSARRALYLRGSSFWKGH